MTIHFITFGSYGYEKALERIKNEAENFGIFDNIKIFTPKELFEYEDFSIHKEFIRKNSRGFGYYIWKPFLVMKYMENINDDDIIFFADAGCELKITGIERMKEYIKLTKESECGNLGFELYNDNDPTLFCEGNWTKMDVIKKLNFEDKINTNHLISGIFFIKKNNFTLNIVKEWYEVSCDYHMIDDTSSIIPNVESFKEHRHDQSVFSILRKKFGCLILKDETYTFPKWNEKMPIWATRKRNS